MRIIRVVNKQAKSNGGISHKLWQVEFTPKDLNKVARMKGNDKGLIYEPKTGFYIEADQAFTHGTIRTKYSDVSKDVQVKFDVKLDSKDELFHRLTYTVRNSDGKLLDTYEVEYPKSARSYKTGSLYSFFTHVMTSTHFLANIENGNFTKEYEELIRKKISRINIARSEKMKKRLEKSKAKKKVSVGELPESEKKDVVTA